MSVRAIDIAYNCLENNKNGLPFKDLWNEIVKKLGYDEVLATKKISQFYTNLTLDGRFVTLGDNVWNLKSQCKYDDIAVKEEYLEDDSEEENEEESEEEYEEESAVDLNEIDY